MKLSIITTTYNSAKTIQQTINSLSNQTYQNLECLWIDNSSEDGTFEILEKNRNSNTKLFKLKNHSISEAWNFGIDKCSGDIVYFLNSDDCLFDDTVFSDVINIFKNYNCNVVFGNINYVNLKRKILRKWTTNIEPNKVYDFEYFRKMIKRGWMPPHPGFFILKSFLSEIGYFNSSYKISFDYDLMIRAIKQKSSKVIYLDKYISNMLLGGTSNKLKNIKIKMTEDLKIIQSNKIGNFFSLILKNLRKIPQFF